MEKVPALLYFVWFNIFYLVASAVLIRDGTYCYVTHLHLFLGPDTRNPIYLREGGGVEGCPLRRP